MKKLAEGRFINTWGRIDRWLSKNGYEVKSYEEKPTNGIYTLTNGQKVSTNGYVYYNIEEKTW